MGVWQGVAMDSLKFHPGPACLTLLCPVGGLQPSSSLLDTPRRMPMVRGKVNSRNELPSIFFIMPGTAPPASLLAGRRKLTHRLATVYKQTIKSENDLT